MSRVRSSTSFSDGALAGVGRAFGRALVSQFHPRMLLALLLPFFVVLLGAFLMMWLFWTPLTEWLRESVMQWQMFEYIDAGLAAAGLVSLQLWLAPIAAALILLPVAGIVGVAIAAVFVMPLVLRHLSATAYVDVAERGRLAFVASAWNAVWVVTLFAAGWLVTMPLWLIPPLALVLPTLWWTFAFTRMLRFDALADFATPDERKLLVKRHNGAFWALGLICALLSLLPPAWLILPVFSALLFAHFGLEALRRLRAETGAGDATASGPNVHY